MIGEIIEMEKVAVIGAGAVGSYILWGLEDKLGENLITVADGERAERLKSKGIVVNDRKLSLNIKTAEEAKGVDVLFVTVKYGALRESLKDIRTVCDDHTVVISLLNGVDSEEIISSVIPENQIVYSLIRIASRREGNNIKFNPPVDNMGIIFGEKDHSVSERVQEIGNIFDDTPIVYHISEDIQKEIWLKYALNISQNLPQAMLGVGYGAYLDSEYVANLRNDLRNEVVQLAARYGIDIAGTGNDTGYGTKNKVDKTARYSTLQDLDAMRHTEIEMLSGTVVRLSKEKGLNAPFNEFTYNFIKALEEKNDGKFEY